MTRGMIVMFFQPNMAVKGTLLLTFANRRAPYFYVRHVLAVMNRVPVKEVLIKSKSPLSLRERAGVATAWMQEVEHQQ